ncbi:hypothetical protein PG985_011561 [Apiospora marii]|uniref:uncharacterized protein n=1 Tax=Apiospora marii TaxID=335849 RepID=UPI0031310A29
MEDRHRQYHSSVATVQIEHCTVPCRRSFAEAKAALEAAVPLLDRTYQRHLGSGDLAAAGEALRMLPMLNRFGEQPRNFGPILQAAATVAKPQGVSYDSTGTPTNTTIKEALQYEIGNPYKAAQMVRLCGQTALYAPIRVALLREGVVSPSAQDDGRAEKKREKVCCDQVRFEYDRPSSTMGSTGIREVDEIARGLDRALHEVLADAAGLDSKAKWSESKI